MKLNLPFYQYQVKIFYGPGLANTNELSTLQNQIITDLEIVNSTSNLNLKYGIFARLNSNELYQLLSQMVISIIYLHQVPVGFFYNYLCHQKVNNRPVVHQGLFVNSKNVGVDIRELARLNSLVIHQQVGDYFTTTLTSTPAMLESFFEYFESSWPHPQKDMRFPPHKEFYRQVTQIVFDEYAKKFFPYAESLELDLRRQIVRSKAIEMGFETAIHHMSRAKSLEINLFCLFWINYHNEEVLLPIAEFNQISKDRSIENLRQIIPIQELIK